MEKLTRRGFFKQTSIGVATVGMLAGVPQMTAFAATSNVPAAVLPAPSVPAVVLPTPTLSEPVMAYVRNLTTGEIGLLIGSREIVYHDPELVMRLSQVVG